MTWIVIDSNRDYCEKVQDPPLITTTTMSNDASKRDAEESEAFRRRVRRLIDEDRDLLDALD